VEDPAAPGSFRFRPQFESERMGLKRLLLLAVLALSRASFFRAFFCARFGLVLGSFWSVILQGRNLKTSGRPS
jgi:hypothetical protein